MKHSRLFARLDAVQSRAEAIEHPMILAIKAIIFSVDGKHSPEEVNDLRSRAMESIRRYQAKSHPGSDWFGGFLEILNDTPTPEPIQ